MIKVNFETDKDIENILIENVGMVIDSIHHGINENYVILVEDVYVPTFEEKIEARVGELEAKNKVLEEENKILKQELSITQDAVNELIFNSLNM